MGRKSLGTAPMTAAERQRRRRTRLAGIEQPAASDPDRTAEQLRARLDELERENRQLRLQINPRPFAPAAAPVPHSVTATPWLARIVANRKR